MSKLAVISVDGHVKASRAGYRDYVEARYLDDFDAWVAAMDGTPDAGNKNPKLPDESQWDSDFRLEHIEGQGVAAEVLFPNGLAFVDARFQDAEMSNDPELAASLDPPGPFDGSQLQGEIHAHPQPHQQDPAGGRGRYR